MAKTSNTKFTPGPRLIDGSELNNALAQPVNSIETGLVATGTTRADALQLQAAINVLATVAASTGVRLKDVPSGGTQTIYNDGASAVQVYATDAIDGIAAATGVALTNAKRAIYTRLPSGAWISAQLGVVSA